MTPTEHGALSVSEFLHRNDSRCAVLGRPIAHSLSPVIHTAGYQALGLDMSYLRVEAGEAREIRELLKHADPGVHGLSVTMPGKAAALELADLSTDRAANIGVANTLVPQGDGTWFADNTDVDGVASCLNYVVKQTSSRGEELLLAGAEAVVVGNGGTSRPAVAALAAAGVAKVTVVARSERALNLQSLVQSWGMEFEWLRFDSSQLGTCCGQAAVVVNTVPDEVAGRYADQLCRARSVVDVIYDPYPTRLLQVAAQKGVPHADGLRMLAGQAEEQFRLFTSFSAPEGLFVDTVLAARGVTD